MRDLSDPRSRRPLKKKRPSPPPAPAPLLGRRQTKIDIKNHMTENPWRFGLLILVSTDNVIDKSLCSKTNTSDSLPGSTFLWMVASMASASTEVLQGRRSIPARRRCPTNGRRRSVTRRESGRRIKLALVFQIMRLACMCVAEMNKKCEQKQWLAVDDSHRTHRLQKSSNVEQRRRTSCAPMCPPRSLSSLHRLTS